MARVTKNLIGIKKTLVFHEGKGRKAKRTSWVMHEYHLPASDFSHETTVLSPHFLSCNMMITLAVNTKLLSLPRAFV